MRLTGYCLALLVTIPAPGAAAEQDAEIWTNFWATGSVKGRLLASVDASVRSSDRNTTASGILVRPMVGVQVSKPISVWLGYTYTKSHPRGRADVTENRYFAQALWTLGNVGKGSLQSRTRLELRRFEGRRDDGWRIRESLRFTHPIGSSKTLVALSTEGFFNLNSTDAGASAGFDQIRNFVGINTPLMKNVALEAGYMNRYIRRSGAVDRMDHIMPVTVSYRF